MNRETYWRALRSAAQLTAVLGSTASAGVACGGQLIASSEDAPAVMSALAPETPRDRPLASLPVAPSEQPPPTPTPRPVATPEPRDAGAEVDNPDMRSGQRAACKVALSNAFPKGDSDPFLCFGGVVDRVPTAVSDQDLIACCKLLAVELQSNPPVEVFNEYARSGCRELVPDPQACTPWGPACPLAMTDATPRVVFGPG
jgi:hypothetical protein